MTEILLQIAAIRALGGTLWNAPACVNATSPPKCQERACTSLQFQQLCGHFVTVCVLFARSTHDKSCPFNP
jgi:hypothetical protein